MGMRACIPLCSPSRRGIYVGRIRAMLIRIGALPQQIMTILFNLLDFNILTFFHAYSLVYLIISTY